MLALSMALAGAMPVADYLKQRESLVASEEQMRFDASTHLTPAEKKVNAKLAALKDSQRTSPSGDLGFLPAVPFHLAKPVIEKTELFELLGGMPKVFRLSQLTAQLRH
jgi:hypothetical protein